jgi:hypothetical protein
LKQVVLPAPFGPIKAWILPRRILRETSRTAKNPANSLVNPWVSRMNSSDNQIPPQTIAAASLTPRVAIFSLQQVPPRGSEIPRFFRALNFVPGPAASEPEYAVIAPPCARRKAAQIAAPPLVL